MAQLRDLGSEVHRLSYELHPARLEQLGLAAAVRGLCRELAVAYEMAIDFEHDEVPSALSQDVMLCLYRIVQEALQNVVRHSGTARATVELRVTRGVLCPTITDDGCGFDPQALPNGAALGLVSMRERMRLVRGQLNVDPDLAAEALRLGASAYLLESCASSELFTAIRMALCGQPYVTPLLTQGTPLGVFLREAGKPAAGKLTDRQREVLQLLVEGRSMKEAAALLSLTPRTVAFHKYSVMEVLGVETSAELVRYAVEHRLVMPNV